MADLSIPARDSVAAQQTLFECAERECGLSLRVLSQRTPIAYNTLRGWRDGTVMPAWALGALGEAGVPDHLLSLVTRPWNRSLLTDEETDSDLDEAADAASEFATEVLRARSPRSPGGTAIVPQERGKIIPLCRRAKAKIARVS